MMKNRIILPVALIAFSFLFSSLKKPDKPIFGIKVEVEESIYKFEPANNGAGPVWCHGNTCIVRNGDKVIASGLETIKGAKPLNNTRWMLFQRLDKEKCWELIQKDEKDRTREPCPIGRLNDGRVFLSVNPTLTEPDQYDGPAEPRILQFDAANMQSGYETLIPEWEGHPEFTEHSYRSFSVDATKNEMILFQNIGYTHAEWTFCDGNGNWVSKGKLHWPWGGEYDKPQPIRVCYPAVQLKDSQVHFLGISDIEEPNQRWRDYKFNLTGRKWDYDFRKLYYTRSEDIRTGKFEEWVEVADREKTAGGIFPCDMWIDPDGKAHILWTERALDERLHKEFFPDEKQSYALNYGIIENGKVVFRKAVMLSNKPNMILPGRGRFQVTPENRLFIFYYVHSENNEFRENRIIEVMPDHSFSAPVKLQLQRPLNRFFTATVRAGSEPSEIIDVYGKDDKNEMRYVRIRILPTR